MNAGRLDKLIERFLRKNSADSEQDSLRKAEENDFGKNSTNNSIARNRRFRRPPLRRTPENEPDEASSSINTDRVNQRYSSEEIDEQINEIDPNFPSTSTTFAQVFPQISNATDIINKDVNNRSKAGVPDETGNQPGLLTPSSSDRSADNPMTQHAPFVASNRDFSSNAVTSTTATLNSSIVSPSVMTSGSSTHQDLSALNRVDSSTIPATRKFDFGVYNFGNREIGQNQPHPRVPNNPVKMELNSPDGSGCKSISSAYAYAAAANFAEFLSSNSGLSSAAAAVAASTNSPYSLMQHPISSINLRPPTNTYAYDQSSSVYPPSSYYQHYQPIHSPNSNGNANYVVQNSQAPSSPAMSGDDESSTGGQISHMARTPPETLEWLNNNYEASEGASLPRCTLYDHYLAHCEELNLRPVNAASFGKLIRSVFQKLKTRRLGTRGNSKYHYNGIRIKATSNLLNFVSAEEYNRMNATTNQTARNTRRSSSAQHSNISQQGRASSNSTPTTVPTSNYQLRSRTFHSNSIENGQQSQLQYGNMSGQESMNEYSSNVANSDSTALYNQSHNSNNEFQPGNFTRNRTGSSSSQIHEPRRASRGSVSGSSSSGGAGSEPEAPVGSMAVGAEGREVPRIPMPNIEEMEEYLLPLGYTISHVLKFMDAYTENCQKILNCMKNLQFDAVEGIWARFWQGSVNDQLSSDIDMTDNSDGTPTVNLDQAHIYGLCTLPQLQKYIETMDLAFYQVIVEVLIPDVLRTDLSPQLSVQIRNFAKSIEQWCMKAIVNAPSAIKKSKLESIRLLSNTLTRYTCFNHLTSAAKSVLENKEQIAQMYNDFCRVDFPVVHSQTEWICGCDSVFITSIERAFKENLRLHKNLDEWTEWLEAVVDQALAKYHDKPIRVLVDASKQFLLKWSFYSSMILRDVTYRSAQSFGSFHLIRLLYDEYMFLLVEMRLAKATNQPMIGVMGQKWLRGDSPSEFCSTPGLQNSAFTVPLRDPQTTTMITLNGCNSHSTTAYVTPTSHLGEPTYTHIHNTPLTASTSMTMAIPSHSGGIQYVIDHSTISPKYSALHTSSSQAPAHLTDILVRDDPSLASIAHHSIGANFGHEIANSGSNSRYMVLNNHHHQEQHSSSSSASAPTTMPTTYTHHNQQQPLGTIVYMEDILEDVRVDDTPNMVDNDKERIMSDTSMERQEDQLRGQQMGENELVPRKKFKTEVDSTLEEK